MGTILEHEQMDFSSSSPPPPSAPLVPITSSLSTATSLSVVNCTSTVTTSCVSNNEQQRPLTPDFENLHALPRYRWLNINFYYFSIEFYNQTVVLLPCLFL